MEATGRTQWFERLLAEQGHELWVGDAAQIRAGVVRKQKTDPRDAGHILKMLREYRFPRIWIPSPAERDLRQLLQHRVRLVRFRTSVMNQLQALAMGQGLCQRKKLWTSTGRNKLESLVLGRWANRRKQELLQMLDRLSSSIQELDQAVKKEAESRSDAVCMMSQPGVGPITALALVLTLGPVAGELLITASKMAFWRNGSASLISRMAAIHSDRDARWRPGRPSLPLHRSWRGDREPFGWDRACSWNRTEVRNRRFPSCSAVGRGSIGR